MPRKFSRRGSLRRRALGQIKHAIQRVSKKLSLFPNETLRPEVDKLHVHRNFNPSRFISREWRVVERDPACEKLAFVELKNIKLENVLNDHEREINGKERLSRIKEVSSVRLDADVFFSFIRNKDLIPEGWKGKIFSERMYIFFDGTILENNHGVKAVLYICWDAGEWQHGLSRIDSMFGKESLSATLPLAIMTAA